MCSTMWRASSSGIIMHDASTYNAKTTYTADMSTLNKIKASAKIIRHFRTKRQCHFFDVCDYTHNLVILVNENLSLGITIDRLDAINQELVRDLLTHLMDKEDLVTAEGQMRQQEILDSILLCPQTSKVVSE